MQVAPLGRPPHVPARAPVPSPSPPPLPTNRIAPPPVPSLPTQTLPESADSAESSVPDDRERLFETYGFVGSLVLHTIVLLCLALTVQVEVPRQPSITLVSAPVADEPLEETEFEELIPVVIPEREVETDLVDFVTVSSVDDRSKQAADLVIGEVADVISPPSSPSEVWTAFADEGLLLASLGGDGEDGGGRGGVGASFYGLSARGQTFVFVTDCSGSMMGRPFEGLLRELRTTIESLPERAEFAVVFFNHGPILRSALTMERATSETKKDYLEWIDGVQPSGGTDPSLALAEALKLKPSVVFLLTDGQFTARPTWDVIRKFNRARRVQIHTIALGAQADVPLLREISRKNRGELRIVRD